RVIEDKAGIAGRRSLRGEFKVLEPPGLLAHGDIVPEGRLTVGLTARRPEPVGNGHVLQRDGIKFFHKCFFYRLRGRRTYAVSGLHRRWSYADGGNVTLHPVIFCRFAMITGA